MVDPRYRVIDPPNVKVIITPVTQVSRPLCRSHGPGQAVPYRVMGCMYCAPAFGLIVEGKKTNG